MPESLADSLPIGRAADVPARGVADDPLLEEKHGQVPSLGSGENVISLDTMCDSCGGRGFEREHDTEQFRAE